MAMKVSQWTSSYNDQFRDKNNIISPNAGPSRAAAALLLHVLASSSGGLSGAQTLPDASSSLLSALCSAPCATSGEPMYHFPGHYDPSHYQRDPGFYGTRASLAATAREAALASGQTVRTPVRGDGPVGYGQAPTRDNNAGRTHSFYAPPPESSSQNFSALRQSTINGLNTQRIPLDPSGGFGQTARLGGDSSSSFSASSAAARGGQSQPLGGASGSVGPGASYGDKDLWTHPILAHGDKSSYHNTGAAAAASSQRFASTTFPASSASSSRGVGVAQQSFGASNGAQSARFGTTSMPYYQGFQRGATAGQNGAYTSAESANALTGLVDPAFVDAPDQWRYDARGAAMPKEIDLRRNTDPRGKYMIPGYSGFIRGKQFEFGQTFAKMTRVCMDVPLDLPTDVDN